MYEMSWFGAEDVFEVSKELSENEWDYVSSVY